MTSHQQALSHLRHGDWQAAHPIVQELEDAHGCWLHAVVHRLEGDLDNARYWYRRAGRAFDPALPVAEELECVATALSAGTGG